MYGATTTVQKTRCFLAILALVSAQCATTAVAGDFRTRTSSHSPARSQIVFSGTIEPGDDRKLVQVLKDAGPGTVEIALNSSGGDMATALSMGEIVRTALLTTDAPMYLPEGGTECAPVFTREAAAIPKSDCLCASACFFTWAAGIKRSGMVLAVHRPYLGKEDLRKATLDEVDNAYQQVAEQSRMYLERMGINKNIINKINKINPNETYYISLEEIDQITGRRYVPSVNDWLAARCGEESDTDYRELAEMEQSKIFGRTIAGRVYKPKRYQELLATFRAIGKCEFNALYEERQHRLADLVRQTSKE